VQTNAFQLILCIFEEALKFILVCMDLNQMGRLHNRLQRKIRKRKYLILSDIILLFESNPDHNISSLIFQAFYLQLNIYPHKIQQFVADRSSW